MVIRPILPGPVQWFMRALVNLVQNHIDVWPFLEAVSPEEVPDYYEVIKDAISMVGSMLHLDPGVSPRVDPGLTLG